MHNDSCLFDSSDLFASPELYPEHLDSGKREVTFCRMTPESYKQSPFLDHRIVKPDQWSKSISIEKLADFQPPPYSRPVNYIFHSAFCCSTLLTRYLDNLQAGLVLREPHSLYEAASILRFRGTGVLSELPASDWELSYRFIERLLARRYQASDSVFIKPSDGCNNLAADLLSTHSGNRGIFLYSTLERFLVSVIKAPNRHEWARIRARELSLDHMRRTGHVLADPRTLNIPQTAALVWIHHMSTYRLTADSPVGAQMVALDSQILMERPSAALDRILQHFGLNFAPERITAMLDANNLSIHSKETDMRYSNELRERDFHQSRQSLSGEVDSATQWASGIAGEQIIANDLHNRLMD